jgi:hypothetical protein
LGLQKKMADSFIHMANKLIQFAPKNVSEHPKTGMSFAEAIKRGMARPKRKNNDYIYHNSDRVKGAP